jgi:heme oxygenase (staphylobilin-producing)
MFVSINRLQVPDEASAQRIEQGFSHANGMADVPGFVRLELWKGPDDRSLEVVTHWRSRDDFDAWRTSDAFRHAHRDTRGTEQVKSQLVTYEVLLSR